MIEKERVSIFIDGGNFHHSTKKIIRRGFEVDIERIINKLSKGRDKTTFYYTTLLDKDYNFDKYIKQNKILDKLRKIANFNVVLCDLRKINIDGTIKYEIKGDDVRLAHDLLIGAFDNLYDTAIIVSGDADFIPIIKTLRERFNKKIGNCYFRKTSSYKLRKSCDFSINMNKLIRNLNS